MDIDMCPEKCNEDGGEKAKDSASICSKTTDTGDLVDIDVDPKYLMDSLLHVQSISESAASTLSFLKDMHPCQAFTDLDLTLHQLYARLCDLEAIAAAYVMTDDPRHCDKERHIDPAVLKWLADCVICLLGVQARVEEELDRQSKALSQNEFVDMERLSLVETIGPEDEDAASDEWTIVDDEAVIETGFVDQIQKLKEFVERLEVFLPIFAA
jgi:hypothetical protein